MKREFAGILQTSFGMVGTVHFSLEMPGSFIGDANQFLEGARRKRVLVTVETQEVAD
ncbi:MAG: hypothetical protein PHY05_02930 [Methanothrix sp.]|nr:hypothetical protein [Methanothrix sp.]